MYLVSWAERALNLQPKSKKIDLPWEKRSKCIQDKSPLKIVFVDQIKFNCEAETFLKLILFLSDLTAFEMRQFNSIKHLAWWRHFDPGNKTKTNESVKKHDVWITALYLQLIDVKNYYSQSFGRGSTCWLYSNQQRSLKMAQMGSIILSKHSKQFVLIWQTNI
jgi:hypothetical protein